ncbi:MAG: Asp-tRNA(Asn)/Glu-tRNA(Gln) amidotransferase GatCAB subunit A [Comamonas sp.]|nr:Asp-tRNA(Asn)/Glu-tRNA(Gln) amidotransferase GatCAB subunit A [Comamonas sp.]
MKALIHQDVFVHPQFDSPAASAMLEGYRSPFIATVLQRLADAGIPTEGTVAASEFGAGLDSSADSAPAQAVAQGQAAAVLVNDHLGQMRLAASAQGLCCARPSYGRASRYGLIASASSFDQAAVITRTVAESARLLSALCGADLEHDATSLNLPEEDFSRLLGQDVKGLKLGILTPSTGSGHGGEEDSATTAARQALQAQGMQTVAITLPHHAWAAQVANLLAAAELSSNLVRYDGVRYGHRAKDVDDLQSLYERSRSEGFGAAIQERILLGTHMLREGFYQRYYQQAQKVRRLIANELLAALGGQTGQCDVLLTPMNAELAALPTMAGLPAVALPGIQLIGAGLQEAQLLQVAQALQASVR